MSELLDPRLGNCRRIFLHDFSLQVSIGFHDYELTAPQRVLINVDLYVPLAMSTPKADELDEVAPFGGDLAQRVVHGVPAGQVDEPGGRLDALELTAGPEQRLGVSGQDHETVTPICRRARPRPADAMTRLMSGSR